MCTDHIDRIKLYAAVGLLALFGSIGLQSYVFYLMVDFNFTVAFQDIKVISLSVSLLADLFLGGSVIALFVKASELLRTIDSVVGSSRAASLHLLSSDDQ